MAQRTTLQLRLSNGLEILAGFWLMISPFGLGIYLLNPPLWNHVMVGVLVSFFSVLRLVLPPRYGGLSWLNMGLGLWLIASPFLFGFADISAALWNSVIVGLVVVALAFWSHLVTGRESESGVAL